MTAHPDTAQPFVVFDQHTPRPFVLDNRPLHVIVPELQAALEKLAARIEGLEAREREREGDGK